MGLALESRLVSAGAVLGGRPPGTHGVTRGVPTQASPCKSGQTRDFRTVRGPTFDKPRGAFFNGTVASSLLPPNGPGIELPAARDLTTVQPTAARPCPLPMRAAGGWGRPRAPRGAAAVLGGRLAVAAPRAGLGADATAEPAAELEGVTPAEDGRRE